MQQCAGSLDQFQSCFDDIMDTLEPAAAAMAPAEQLQPKLLGWMIIDSIYNMNNHLSV